MCEVLIPYVNENYWINNECRRRDSTVENQMIFHVLVTSNNVDENHEVTRNPD
jgi:hypothetical protein